jgi:Tfp pilus assembly protein PilZ
MAGPKTLMGKAINLSTAGMLIMTSEPISKEEKLGLEFLLEFLMPHTLNSIRVEGESVWTCTRAAEKGDVQGIGIKFVDLEEPYLSMIRDYAQEEGIIQVLSDIRNLPSSWRLKAYHILLKKGSGYLTD